jgi:hypothetical protein
VAKVEFLFLVTEDRQGVATYRVAADGSEAELVTLDCSGTWARRWHACYEHRGSRSCG